MTLDSRRRRQRMASNRGLPGGLALVVVGAAFCRVAQLHDRHDVQHPVDPPVPGPRQPVAGLFTGGGVDRGGAVPGGEPFPIGDGQLYCYCDGPVASPPPPLRELLAGYAEPVPTLLDALDEASNGDGTGQAGAVEEVVLDSWSRGAVLLI